MIDLQLLGGLAVAPQDSSTGSPAPRRRALALLALVAAAPQPVPREKVLALLWPESDSTRARNSLRQTIFALRRDLNEDIFLPESRSGLQLDPAHIRVDLWEFRDAMARDVPSDAVAAYRGPFLDGFHVPGLSVFSQWAESERDVVARQYAAALDALARRAHCDGRYDDAVEWRRRIAAGDPLDARAALALLQALAAAGDRAGALKQAAAHERLVREELETEPDPVISEFATSLRRDSTPISVRAIPADARMLPITVPAPVAAVPFVAAPAVSTPEVVTRSVRRRHRTRAWLPIGAVALIITASGGRWVAAAVTGVESSREVHLGSGLQDISSRDPGTRLMACAGPACPAGALPVDAYIVAPHPAYAPPTDGTRYIAPVPDATTIAAKGYGCCTTAAFETDFHLPPDAVSATITVTAHADNQAIVAINGLEFGRQQDKLGSDNYAGLPTAFATTFVPDPSGTNRLRVTLWDGGGALGLQYSATITYETEASLRKEAAAARK